MKFYYSFILGDPGVVIRAGRKGATKVFKLGRESRYPGALPPVLENFRRAFSPGPTDCSWVSEDGTPYKHTKKFPSYIPEMERQESAGTTSIMVQGNDQRRGGEIWQRSLEPSLHDRPS